MMCLKMMLDSNMSSGVEFDFVKSSAQFAAGIVMSLGSYPDYSIMSYHQFTICW
jgi:hypothetical protein